MSLSNNAKFVNQILNDYQKGKKIESINKLEKVVKKFPKDNIARYNLALMQHENGKTNEAINNYKKVKKNDDKNWKSRFNLYLIYIEQKKFEEALILIDEVLLRNKNYQPALRDKALVLVNLKMPNKGLPFIQSSLQQNSKDYIALNVLGIIYVELNRLNEAKNIFKAAIQINKNYVSSYNNLGRCYALLFNKEESFKFYKKALSINPNYVDAINNIANYYVEKGLYKKSLDFYFKALKIKKNDNEILFNIGCAYFYLKDYKLAKKYYELSLALNASNSLLQKNYAILLLSLHHFYKAWKYFDGRFGANDFKNLNHHFHNIKDKLWKGKPINKNAKLLVIKEQGIGDEILYGSMYKDLLSKFPNTKIETEPRLLSIFKRSINNNAFVNYGKFSKDSNVKNNFDFILYAGSLGRIFRNDLKDFNGNNFLFPKKDIINKIHNKYFANIKNKKIIGISWKSKNKTYGEDKSLDLDILKPILEIKNCLFVNLQYGETLEEIMNFSNKTKIKILNIKEIDLFNDFESIAALLKNLDLLISVSNSTVHLAGAVGVNTWVIKPKEHALFHYWNQPNDKSPWYKSIKLYPFVTNWENTIKKIRKKLITIT